MRKNQMPILVKLKAWYYEFNALFVPNKLKGPYIKYDRNFLAFFDPLPPLWLQNDVIVTK